MNKKGITPVIAIILLLMLTVSAGGAAFFFIQSLQSETAGSIQGGMSSITNQFQSRIKIIAVNEAKNKVYFQNTGSADLQDFTVLVNGSPYAQAAIMPSILQPGEIGTAELTGLSGLYEVIIVADSTNAKVSERTWG